MRQGELLVVGEPGIWSSDQEENVWLPAMIAGEKVVAVGVVLEQLGNSSSDQVPVKAEGQEVGELVDCEPQ